MHPQDSIATHKNRHTVKWFKGVPCNFFFNGLNLNCSLTIQKWYLPKSLYARENFLNGPNGRLSSEIIMPVYFYQEWGIEECLFGRPIV